ncbi:MAG: CNNM domain-containing protein, partial [Streptosporangiaceae bacterium]
MNQVGWDIVLVLLIVLVGGFFAAAEMALVSLREGQIRALMHRGRRGQRAARLAQDPNRFLSSVQIGVTLATLLSGTVGEATLAGHLRTALFHEGLTSGWATALSLIIVTVVISYFTLVLGELAPKRLALQRPEKAAMLAAPTLDRISVLARPLVWLLSRSINLVVRLLGGDPAAGRGVMTEEELRDVVAGHQALSADERHIVGEVFNAGKRQIREVLVPRTEVEFLAADTPLQRALEIVAGERYSRFPVYQQSYDDVIGFIHVRDLIDPQFTSRQLTVGEIRRPVKLLPMSKTVLSALSEMRRDRAHLAIVMDEYGGTAGIVTLEDLVEELVGDIQDEYDVDEGQPKQLRGGAIEVDGLLNLDEFAEQTGIELPEGPYETVAGYMLATLGQLPAGHETVQADGHVLTVLAMDGWRIARVRVDPAPGDSEAEARDGAAPAPALAAPAAPAHSPAPQGANSPDSPGNSPAPQGANSPASAPGNSPGPPEVNSQDPPATPAAKESPASPAPEATSASEATPASEGPSDPAPSPAPATSPGAPPQSGEGRGGGVGGGQQAGGKRGGGEAR